MHVQPSEKLTLIVGFLTIAPCQCAARCAWNLAAVLRNAQNHREKSARPKDHEQYSQWRYLEDFDSSLPSKPAAIFTGCFQLNHGMSSRKADLLPKIQSDRTWMVVRNWRQWSKKMTPLDRQIRIGIFLWRKEVMWKHWSTGITNKARNLFSAKWIQRTTACAIIYLNEGQNWRMSMIYNWGGVGWILVLKVVKSSTKI